MTFSFHIILGRSTASRWQSLASLYGLSNYITHIFHAAVANLHQISIKNLCSFSILGKYLTEGNSLQHSQKQIWWIADKYHNVGWALLLGNQLLFRFIWISILTPTSLNNFRMFLLALSLFRPLQFYEGASPSSRF